MRSQLLSTTLALALSVSTIAAPLPGPPVPLPAHNIQARGPDLPKPTTLHALVFGSVISGIALVVTKKLYEDWQIYHMDPSSRPLPINLTPDPKQVAHDQRAITRALQRIASAAESQEGRNVGELELSPEDAAVISALTPEQKEMLGHILLSSAQGPDTPITPASTTPQALRKRLTYFQAGLSGVLSGIAFAISAVAVQEAINRQAGPASSWQKRSKTSHPADGTLEELD